MTSQVRVSLWVMFRRDYQDQEFFPELMSEPNEASCASQRCTGGDKTEFIECKASRMIPSKSTLTGNDEKVSGDHSV